jgi:predicted enzyme related to lactoylglutathione lyase
MFLQRQAVLNLRLTFLPVTFPRVRPVVLSGARVYGEFASVRRPGGTMSGEPAFFEIGVDDPERGKAFYGALFDWNFEPGPSGEGSIIHTSGITGGMHGGDPGAGPYVFFRVEDMDAALDRVRQLGGSVEDSDIGDEASAAEYGRFKLCKDDQGSPFGLHEPPNPDAQIS